MRSILFATLAVVALLMLSVLLTCEAFAADYRLVDRSGNEIMPVTHGTTIDLHDLTDRSFLKLQASFDSSDHASWLEFTLVHSARSFDYTHTDRIRTDGWWSVCPSRCYALRRTDR